VYHHESLKLYDEKDGSVLVGIKGRYLMKPRWYKIRTTKGSQEEYIQWKGKRVYMNEIVISEEYMQERNNKKVVRINPLPKLRFVDQLCVKCELNQIYNSASGLCTYCDWED
jgi:hypothetical protein